MDWKPPGNLTLKASGFDHKISTGLGSRLLENTDKTLSSLGPRSKDLTRDWARLSCECPGVLGGGVGWQWPATGSGTLNTTILGAVECWHKSFWRRCHCPYQSLALGETTGRECSPTHQQKIGLKIYWAWPCPLEQRKAQFYPQPVPPTRKLAKTLIHIHQRVGRMKITITEN